MEKWRRYRYHKALVAPASISQYTGASLTSSSAPRDYPSSEAWHPLGLLAPNPVPAPARLYVHLHLPEYRLSRNGRIARCVVTGRKSVDSLCILLQILELFRSPTLWINEISSSCLSLHSRNRDNVVTLCEKPCQTHLPGSCAFTFGNLFYLVHDCQILGQVFVLQPR